MGRAKLLIRATQFLILLVTAGLRFPITAAIAGAVYTAGRVVYFLVRLFAPLLCVVMLLWTRGVRCTTASVPFKKGSTNLRRANKLFASAVMSTKVRPLGLVLYWAKQIKCCIGFAPDLLDFGVLQGYSTGDPDKRMRGMFMYFGL